MSTHRKSYPNYKSEYRIVRSYHENKKKAREKCVIIDDLIFIF